MFRSLLVLVLCLCLETTLVHGSNDNERKEYIVYMGALQGAGTSAMVDHHNLLLTAIGEEETARESKIYTYRKSFNGFVARLLPHEVQSVSADKRVVSVFPNTVRKLHTTRTWDFLGMSETLSQANAKRESDIVVGLLDTGIWAEAPSFNDTGYGPVPIKWKGKCVNFTGCNRKVVGAKYFKLDQDYSYGDTPSPVDDTGHGTHTSSTAAGVFVKDASLYGLGTGTARGGVPSARIAMYKVCWDSGCSDSDVLAAFDEAIADGVDLISASMGGPSRSFFEDSIAIGSFHAMKKGILTSCSAGNGGPAASTVENVAPWIMTVAASGIDRQFRTVATLGNGKYFSGISINTFSPQKMMYPLTSGALAANVSEKYGNASACDFDTLDKNKVVGKIVYCLGSAGQDSTIKDLGGAGTIMALEVETDIAYSTVIPGTSTFPRDSKLIEQYINSTKNPQAVIQKTTTINVSAPFVASFSSRGPQKINLNILKPDISAPGVDILAAYSTLATTTGYPNDDRHTVFNIISGTSMACPHASAAAVYVKSFHPDWSPAAVKSALMTTATPMKSIDTDAELGSGSGQINPTQAVNPGLIYDISMSSYISFLCNEGYNNTIIDLIVGGLDKIDCTKFKPAQGTDGLNYPTLHTQLDSNSTSISATFYRTVTNVGYATSVYTSKVTSPRGLLVKVIPETLKFSKLNENQSFTVEVQGSLEPTGSKLLSALLEWSDSKHNVKSHIVILRPLAD
ncbi:subtilisin-like protease SBT4.15 [Castanea sativa]|uniref:subtilisin-like protease SBT4.15 n=1 Tax=Castanea sativa TaxID=21020 RepID=UPI003F652EE2